jgi:hypothetical protein
VEGEIEPSLSIEKVDGHHLKATCLVSTGWNFDYRLASCFAEACDRDSDSVAGTVTVPPGLHGLGALGGKGGGGVLELAGIGREGDMWSCGGGGS